MTEPYVERSETVAASPVIVAPSRAVRRDTRHTLSLVEPALQAGDAVLDVGCGAAYVTSAIAVRHPDTWGVDIVDDRRAELANFARYDGRTLEFPDRRFDVVIFAFVLHHVPNALKPRLVGEARRVCKRALLIVEDTPRTAIDRWFSRRHGETFRNKIGSTAEFGFYTQPEWEQFLDREGLDVVESRAQPYARSLFVARPRP
jgi:ubiquinone/menaquinone biosynthesis C-methylase UbiE